VWGDTQKANAGGEKDAKLAAAVSGSLEVADELKLSSISLPAISTGIFGFPKERAAGVILLTIKKYFSHCDSRIKLIRLVLFDDATIRAFIGTWNSVNW
jgi:O-acetyl-ADP-ribose deacetylase (regulator of RNase III)